MLARIAIIFLLTTSIVNASDCDEKSIYCSIPGGTRKIQGVNVTRDCWQYKYSLDCTNQSKNNCKQIDHNKCTYVGQECVKELQIGSEKYCINYKKKYSCEREIQWEEERTEVENGEDLNSQELLCESFCIDGKCDAVKKAKTEENTEMAEAVGYMNAVKKAPQGITDGKLLSILKGEARSCANKVTEYTNCCTKMGGWGKMLGAKCSPEAKNLAQQRKANRCIEVGTYCSSKLLGVCVIKETSFCCYDPIGKIFNQAAFEQIPGINFGTAEHPNCNGLKIEDLEKLTITEKESKAIYNDVILPTIKVPDSGTEIKMNSKAVEDIAKRAASQPMERQGFSKNIEQKEYGHE